MDKGKKLSTIFSDFYFLKGDCGCENAGAEGVGDYGDHFLKNNLNCYCCYCCNWTRHFLLLPKQQFFFAEECVPDTFFIANVLDTCRIGI